MRFECHSVQYRYGLYSWIIHPKKLGGYISPFPELIFKGLHMNRLYNLLRFNMFFMSEKRYIHLDTLKVCRGSVNLCFPAFSFGLLAGKCVSFEAHLGKIVHLYVGLRPCTIRANVHCTNGLFTNSTCFTCCFIEYQSLAYLILVLKLMGSRPHPPPHPERFELAIHEQYRCWRFLFGTSWIYFIFWSFPLTRARVPVK